ncbi:hypothetical protein ACTNDG_07320 [Clostridium sp. HCP1S3_B4]|uniref:hypothetical protein n=1 Tax=unclassified Clostridium TaxID=2614128 RepID=UPI003F88E157
MIFNDLCCILFPLIVYLLVFLKIDTSLKKVEKSVVTLNKMLLNHLKMNTNLNSINKIA